MRRLLPVLLGLALLAACPDPPADDDTSVDDDDTGQDDDDTGEDDDDTGQDDDDTGEDDDDSVVDDDDSVVDDDDSGPDDDDSGPDDDDSGPDDDDSGPDDDDIAPDDDDATEPAPDLFDPVVTMVLSPNPVASGGSVSITVVATDDVTVSPVLDLEIDGAPVPLSGGAATWTAGTCGLFTTVATATDDAGNIDQDVQILQVIDSTDASGPSVSISSPAPEAQLSWLTPLQGTAADGGNLVEWTATLTSAEGGDAIEVASGTTEVTGGLLGDLDPTMVLEGWYTLTLSATDCGGNSSSTSIEVEVIAPPAPGLFTLSFEDVHVRTGGIDIQVVRTYDSRERSVQGDFGYGWSLELFRGDVDKTTDEYDAGWYTQGCGFLCTELLAGDDPIISLDLGGGNREHFVFTPQCTDMFCGYMEASYTSLTSPGATITPLDADITLDLVGDQLWELYAALPYNPTRYQFDFPDGSTVIAGLDGIESLTDPAGNTIEFNGSSITNSDGGVVNMTYTGGVVTQVTDPLGNSVDYTYDAAGDLQTVTDRDGNVTTFVYSDWHPHLVETVIGPDGLTYDHNIYDEDGRLIQQCNIDGECVEYVHDLANQAEAVIDRGGYEVTTEYDAEGNVSSVTDALGNQFSWTHDAEGNVTGQTDAEGNLVEYGYDSNGVRTSETIWVDGSPHTRSWSFDSAGNMTGFTNAAGESTSFAFNGFNKPTSISNAVGSEALSYDSAGRVTSHTDADGVATSVTYDVAGRIDTVSDAYGNTAGYTYDALGRVTSTTVALGGLDEATVTRVLSPEGYVEELIGPMGTSTTYDNDALGRPVVITSPKGQTTEVAYGSSGRIEELTWADGTSVSAERDADGRLTTLTNEDGDTTSYAYDAAGRMTGVGYADGTTIDWALDGNGETTQVSGSMGRQVDYVLDERGRVLQASAGGESVSYEYDEVGRMVALTDAEGVVTEYDYDDAGRLQGVSHAVGTPDEYSISAGLTPGGRQLDMEDTFGRSWALGYDDSGLADSLTDPMGNTWSADYDGRGNLTGITDPDGRTTAWDYDLADRIVGRTLPSGSSEAYLRDSTGLVTQHVDFDGGTTTRAYDVRDRVEQIVLPGGTTYDLAWTASSRRATVTDDRGTTARTYDAAGRITVEVQPDGAILEYGWTAAHQLASRTVTVGGVPLTTTYAYDDWGRLTEVTDPAGGVTLYEFDLDGRPVEVAHANGTTTSYDYDAAGHLLDLEHADASGALLGWAYDWQGSELATVLEADGSTESYVHDSTGMLESAVRTGVDPWTDVFAWDGAAGVTEATRDGTPETWLYDGDGRLVDRGGVTYTWDASGRLLTRDDGTLLSIDWEGERLVGATYGADVLALEYDVDGFVVTRTVNGVATHYLWDRLGPVPRLLATYDDTGALLEHFVWDQTGLLQVHDGAGDVATVFRDRRSSVRGLSDPSGALTDTWNYDVWGAPVSHTGASTQPYGFGGMVMDDALGLYYAQARWYEPEAGRFLSMDPVHGTTENPLTFNPWVFGLGDPVHYLDPTGRFSMAELTVSMAIKVTLAAMIGTAIVKAWIHVQRFIYEALGGKVHKWKALAIKVGVGVDLQKMGAGAGWSAGVSGGLAYHWTENPQPTDPAGHALTLRLTGKVGYGISGSFASLYEKMGGGGANPGGGAFSFSGFGATAPWKPEGWETYNMGISWILDWPIDGPPSPWSFSGMFISSTVGKVSANFFFGLLGGSFTLISHTFIHQGIVISADGGGGLFKLEGPGTPDGPWGDLDVPWEEAAALFGNGQLGQKFTGWKASALVGGAEASAFSLEGGVSILLSPYVTDDEVPAP